MKKLRVFASVIALSTILLFMHGCSTLKGDFGKTNNPENNNWVAVFNGKDLSGFTMKIKGYPLGENFGNTFRVEDRILKIRYDGYGDDLNGRFGTLYIDRPLANYRLRVTYRFVGETAPGAPDWGYRDSGIQFHGQPPATQKIDQPFPMCLEYNFHGGNGSDDRPTGAACGYGISFEVDGTPNTENCVPAKTPVTLHGDEWVVAELDVNQGIITHFVNGQEIMRYTNPKYKGSHETAKEFIFGGETSVKEGYVSFQANSHPMDIKRIELLTY